MTPQRPSALRGPAGLLAPAGCLAAILAVLVARWSPGWLLLLDWSPGPASVRGIGLGLPTGPLTVLVVETLHALWAPLAGWGVAVVGVAASFCGGVRLARVWRTEEGVPLSWTAAGVAGCVAACNPFIAARVYAGQVGVLLGYAALWWFAASLIRSLRSPEVTAALLPAVWLTVAAACSLHLLAVGGLLVLCAAAVQHRSTGWAQVAGRSAVVMGAATGATLLWLVPALGAQGTLLGTPGDERALQAFTSGGAWHDLWLRALGGAAFWRPLPAGSLTSFGLVAAAAWAATAVAWRLGRGRSRDLRHTLGLAAAAAVMMACIGRGPTLGAWAWLVEHVPAVGLMREPGKFLMLTLLLPAVGAAAGVQRLMDRRASGATRSPALIGVGALAATGVVAAASWAAFSGLVRPSAYPADWLRAARIVRTDTCAVAVLADPAYVRPGFTDGRFVAHPARGLLGARAIVSTDPAMVGLEARPASGPAEAWVEAANEPLIRAGAGDGIGGRAPTTGRLPVDVDEATHAGIGWVFVDRPTDRPWVGDALEDAGFVPAVEGRRVGLWRTPETCRAPAPPSEPGGPGTG